MDNKIEFPYSGQRPIYNWEKYNTIVNNWNYYDKYAAIPVEKGKYDVKNCIVNNTYHCYTIENTKTNIPKFSLTLSHRNDDFKKFQLYSTIFGTDHGAHIFNMEEAYKNTNPSAEEVPDYYKDKYWVKRPKDDLLWFYNYNYALLDRTYVPYRTAWINTNQGTSQLSEYDLLYFGYNPNHDLDNDGETLDCLCINWMPRYYTNQSPAVPSGLINVNMYVNNVLTATDQLYDAHDCSSTVTSKETYNNTIWNGYKANPNYVLCDRWNNPIEDYEEELTNNTYYLYKNFRLYHETPVRKYTDGTDVYYRIGYHEYEANYSGASSRFIPLQESDYYDIENIWSRGDLYKMMNCDTVPKNSNKVEAFLTFHNNTYYLQPVEIDYAHTKYLVMTEPQPTEAPHLTKVIKYAYKPVGNEIPLYSVAIGFNEGFELKSTSEYTSMYAPVCPHFIEYEKDTDGYYLHHAKQGNPNKKVIKFKGKYLKNQTWGSYEYRSMEFNGGFNYYFREAYNQIIALCSKYHGVGNCGGYSRYGTLKSRSINGTLYYYYETSYKTYNQDLTMCNITGNSMGRTTAEMSKDYYTITDEIAISKSYFTDIPLTNYYDIAVDNVVYQEWGRYVLPPATEEEETYPALITDTPFDGWRQNNEFSFSYHSNVFGPLPKEVLINRPNNINNSWVCATNGKDTFKWMDYITYPRYCIYKIGDAFVPSMTNWTNEVSKLFFDYEDGPQSKQTYVTAIRYSITGSTDPDGPTGARRMSEITELPQCPKRTTYIIGETETGFTMPIDYIYLVAYTHLTPIIQHDFYDKPATPAADTFYDDAQIRNGVLQSYFESQVTAFPNKDYVVGVEPGATTYGQVYYSKYRYINQQGDIIYNYHYRYRTTSDVRTLSVPPAWIEASYLALPTKPASNGYQVTETIQGKNILYFDLIDTIDDPEFAVPSYQPSNNTILTHNLWVAENPYPYNYIAPNINYQAADSTHAYWMVHLLSEFGPHAHDLNSYVESMNENEYPNFGYQNGYYYMRKADTIGYNLTLYNKDLKDGVSYEHNINGNSDLQFNTVASAEIKFNYYDPLENANTLLNKTVNYYTKSGTEPWKLVGKFTLMDMSVKRQFVNFVGYDDMILSELSGDSFIASTTFPVTVKTLFENLSFYCGLIYNANCIQNTDPTQTASYFPNASQLVYNNFTTANISCRQIFSYIAEVLNCFFYISTSGRIIPGKYTTTNKELDNSDYIEYTFANYSINPISKVVIKSGQLYGFTEGNDTGDTYYITDNPLLYAESKSELQTLLTNTKNNLATISYVPGTVKTFTGKDINIGDIIEVDENTFYVMKKSFNSSGYTFECIGNQNRQSNYQDQDTNIIALNGITKQLDSVTTTIDVDLTDISARFATVTGQISTHNGKIEGLIREQDDLVDRVEELEEDMGAAQTNITSLNSSMTTANTNIANNTTNIATHTNDIQSLNNRVDQQVLITNQHTSSIATLQSNKMDKNDMKMLHLATGRFEQTSSNGIFIGPNGIYWCYIQNGRPTQILRYIDFQNGKTNLELTTDPWSGSIPADIIW